MSWFGYKAPSTNAEPKVSPRTAKRNKLQAERLQRAHQREKLKNQLKAAQEAKDAADLAEAELLALDPDIFEGAIDEEISEDILDISKEPKMANFDSLNEDNGADAIKNLGQIRVNWDGENPSYFFQKLETELQIYSINKQFTKRQALIRCLPDDVAKEFMHLVTLQETQAGDLSYKDLKDALIKAYGPRPGDAFQRAMSRVMVSKPSVYLKLLISDLCKQNLANCCCKTTVWGIFQLQVPMYLKTGLANEDFNATTMMSIMDKADNLWAANQSSKQINTIVQAATTTSSDPSSMTTTEVAAIRGRGNSRGFRGRGRGGRGRGGRGGNQSQGQTTPDPRGKRHESNPPWNSCSAHWVYAGDAFKCQSPTTCPMKDKTKPKA